MNSQDEATLTPEEIESRIPGIYCIDWANTRSISRSDAETLLSIISSRMERNENP